MVSVPGPAPVRRRRGEAPPELRRGHGGHGAVHNEAKDGPVQERCVWLELLGVSGY